MKVWEVELNWGWQGFFVTGDNIVEAVEKAVQTQQNLKSEAKNANIVQIKFLCGAVE